MAASPSSEEGIPDRRVGGPAVDVLSRSRASVRRVSGAPYRRILAGLSLLPDNGDGRRYVRGSQVSACSTATVGRGWEKGVLHGAREPSLVALGGPAPVSDQGRPQGGVFPHPQNVGGGVEVEAVAQRAERG